MKKYIAFKLSIIIFCLFFASCSKDELFVVDNQLDINIEGKEYKLINENVGGNENCDRLYITASCYDKDKTDDKDRTYFTLRFELSKEGNLLKVSFDEHFYDPRKMRTFITPNFNPLSTFDISDFYYDSITGEVKFDFSGTVYLENKASILKNISGKIKIKTLKSIECSTFKKGLSYTSTDLKLFSFYNGASKYEDKTQIHRFLSNNGFRIDLYLSNDLWFYPLGETNFDDSDQTDKVEFKEIIGMIVTDQIGLVKQTQWKNFETSGKIIIEEKYTEKNRKVIRGKLNLLIKDNGQIIYTLNGIDFKTSSFE